MAGGGNFIWPAAGKRHLRKSATQSGMLRYLLYKLDSPPGGLAQESKYSLYLYKIEI